METRVCLILVACSAGCCDGWGCSSAGRAPALQAGGQRFDPAQLHQLARRASGVERARYPSEEIKVCTDQFWFCACFANIVKRRLIWRLPGIGDLSLVSEAGSDDVVDGLAGRIRRRGWHEVGSLSLWSSRCWRPCGASDDLMDGRCLTARSRI